MGASQIENKHNECNLTCDLDPTYNNNYYNSLEEEDDITVVASNKTTRDRESKHALQQKTTDIETREDVNTPRIPITHENRVHAPIFPTRQKAWAKKVELESLKDDINAETMFNTSSIKIAVDQAIADAGATGHFMIPGAPVIDVRPATKPLIINLPDGETIQSTHTCKLNIPWLPEEATRAHIVPGLAHTSLVSIKVLCDAGCKVEYNNKHCLVFYKKKLVWMGRREATTKLWVLPLDPDTPTQHWPYQTEESNEEYAANAYQMTSKASLIKYLHQCLFCPPKLTLLKAIRNNQLTTWPGLTTEAVEKYLPNHAPATDKGHMRRQRKGIRSTKMKKSLETIEHTRDMTPPVEREKMNQLFSFVGMVDKKDGTIYVDNTGNFPITSVDGMKAIYILYDWTTNAILATPIKTATDDEMIRAFKKNITYLTQRGFKPAFNVIDNVASKAIKKYLLEEKIEMQLVEPNNHRANAAERAIQTFKNHFIAGLSIGDKDFPTMIWCKLVRQAQDSLNILRTSRVHPKVLAFHTLE